MMPNKSASKTANPVLVSKSSKVRELLGSSSSQNGSTKTPESVESSEPTLSKIHVSRLDWRVLGTPVRGLHTVAYTTIGEAGVSHAPNYYQDMFAFTVGSTVVVLTTAGSPSPVAEKAERRLLTILYTRAERSLHP